MNTPSSAAGSKDDYFENHELGVKWPFTIYHRPIEMSLMRSIAMLQRRGASERVKVLVFGCGLFHESTLFGPEVDFTLVDSDSRVIKPLKMRLESRLTQDIIIASGVEGLRAKLAGTYDLIVAKEVMEHIVDATAYYQLFYQSLREKGALWMSTPNYGDWTLPLAERTFLEVIARFKGFSRKHIHPNKYRSERLEYELMASGFRSVSIQKTPLLLALTATAVKA